MCLEYGVAYSLLREANDLIRWADQVVTSLFMGEQGKALSFHTLKSLGNWSWHGLTVSLGNKYSYFYARNPVLPTSNLCTELSSRNCAKLLDLNTGLSRDEDLGNADSH